MDNPFAALNNGPASIQEAVMSSYQRGRTNALAEAEHRREATAREAAGTILAGGVQPNALAAFAPPPEPQQQMSSATSQAWRTLAHTDPQLFGQLRQLDNNQRKAAAEALQRNVEIGGRAMGAILDVPEEQREQVYATQLKPWLEQNGMEGLPDQWDENFARAQLRMAATAAQALGVDIKREHLAWDIEDDKADNARADLNTQSLMDYRQGQLANARRGQDLADARGRRGQDIASRDRRDNRTTQSRDRRRGQDISASNKAVKVKTPADAYKLAPGTVFQTPDGRIKVR